MFEDLITVIIPVYNVKDYLSRCLDSVLSQTYLNIEIILSDDGSTDGSSDICDEYCKKDKRIKVIHEENKGLSEARNRGIKIASGKFISFIDSDDWVSPNYLLKLYYALIRTRSDVSECLFKKTQFLDAVGKETGRIETLTRDEILLKLCKSNHECHVVAWNKLYKKDLFNSIRFPAGKLHEDEFTTHLVFFKCNRVSIIRDELYFYYQNPESITNKKISLKRLDSIDGLYSRLLFYKKEKMLTHYNSCSALLFKQFTDYISISKHRFENKRFFIKELQHKFNIAKEDVSLKCMTFEQKITFLLANINFGFIRIYNPLSKLVSFMKRIACLIERLIFKVFNTKERKEKKLFILSCKHFLNNASVKKKTLILGAVEYANYGDLAIGESQYTKLSSVFDVFEISQRDTIRYIKLIKKMFKELDVIFMPGGGNISDIWRFDEDIRRLVIKTFPDKSVVIFPQSYGYTTDTSEYKVFGSTIYNNHGNVTIFARDNYSFNKFKDSFSNCKIRLAPDTVLLSKPVIHKTKTTNIGLCVRDDKETSIDTIKILIAIINLLNANNVSFRFLSTVEHKSISLRNRNAAVQNMINDISDCKFVITDRLHCGIFCILTNTKCMILNNKNSKIKNFINTWNLSKQLKLLNNSDIITTSFFNKMLSSNKNYDIDLTKEFAQLEEVINQYAKI